ncbi:MAG: DMT family transporter [Anaerolineae bacterium]
MLGIAFALAQAISWALTSVVLRTLSTRMGVFLVNGLRAATGLLVLIPLTVISRGLADLPLLTAERLLIIVGSVIGAGVIGDGLYVRSLRLIGMHRAFPLANTYPLFAVLLSVLWLREPVHGQMLAGMLLVIVGVAVMIQPERAANVEAAAESPRRQVEGALLALGAAVAWGSCAVLLSQGVQDIDTILVSSVQAASVMVLSLGLAGRASVSASVPVWRLGRATMWLLLLGGVLNWGAANTFYVAAVRYAGPSRAAIIGSSAPIFAVPLSMLLLHESPTRRTLVGTVITVLGLILVVM